MLLPQRIVLTIAVMIFGGCAILSPKAWAGPKPHHRYHSRAPLIKSDLDQYQVRMQVDDYCPPVITTHYMRRASSVGVTSTTPPKCPLKKVGLSLYQIVTAGPDNTKITRLQGLKVTADRERHSVLGNQLLRFTIPLGTYHSLVGKTNLLLKIQYQQGTSQTLHTIYTTILLIKNRD